MRVLQYVQAHYRDTQVTLHCNLLKLDNVCRTRRASELTLHVGQLRKRSLQSMLAQL